MNSTVIQAPGRANIGPKVYNFKYSQVYRNSMKWNENLVLVFGHNMVLYPIDEWNKRELAFDI